jgi:NADPH2:quinone reductase
MYPARPALPHILGREGLGDVLAVGPGVEGVRLGQTLGFLPGYVGVETWGTLAEKVVVGATQLAPVPESWSLEEMSSAPLVFLSAWLALTQWSDPPAPLPAGSVVLVTGASGGVGTATILLAKTMNLVVVALSRSLQKGARLGELGADFVFNAEEPNLRKAVLTALARRRVDLAVDNVGGPLFAEVVAMLGQGGRISVVGRSGGVVPEFNTATLLFRKIRIGGVTAGDLTTQLMQSTWQEIVARLQAARRRPVVDSVIAFEDVKAAFARLAQGPMGKVLVRVAD